MRPPADRRFLAISSNGGARFTKLILPKGFHPEHWGKQFHGIASDPTGILWAGGTYAVRIAGTKAARVRQLGDDARVKAVVATPFGVLLLTFSGKTYLANGKDVTLKNLRAPGHLSGACVTPSRTALVVGSSGDWKGALYRSTDEARTFTEIRLPKCSPLLSVAALPDGRVIASGEEAALLVSHDDGRTFKVLKHKVGALRSAKLATGKPFGIKCLCTHGDAIYAGGPSGVLVKIA